MGLQQHGERLRPGTFVIGLGNPTRKLNDKLGSFFTWTKHITSLAVSNTCESAFKETENRIVFQGPNAERR